VGLLKDNRNASKFIWNTIGMMCNAGTSFLLLIFVTRICGDTYAGIFALGFANAQLMLTIGRYGMRAYQATDIKEAIPFPTYFLSRIITCISMLFISFFYILWSGYTVTKAIIVFSICIIKMSDAIEDVFHGLFQQRGRIDLAGKFLTYRNVITVLSFIVFLSVTKDLLITCIVTGVISIAACIWLNVPTAKSMAPIRPVFYKRELKTLFISCFPLFIGSFLALYINNVPRYMIDHYLTENIQAFFSILFMPAFVINLFSEFIFKPLLTDIAIKWEENRIGNFMKYIFRLLFGILIITVIVVTGGYFFGSEILSLVYGVDLLGYRKELILLLVSGGFSACVYLLFHVLTAMRKQFILLAGYTVTAVFITLLGPVFVKRYAMFGAAILCIIANLILVLIFSLMLISAVLKKRKENEK
jgi:O-antigen/teichoic acid export membrane protein